MRYAAYIRTSTGEQSSFSIDAQRRVIKQWVSEQGGTLVKTYIDEAQSGRTTDRPAFQNMRRDAQNHQFDALVVHKFDRFARNRSDAIAIKSMLRQEYGIKVFSVSEPSEDSDGQIGALAEGIFEAVADWYSQNLSIETSKGKREKAMQGFHNNRPPFGLDKTPEGVLYPNDQELPGLLLAFESYATGNYSDTEIAQLLNQQGYRSKSGRPFATDTIRDLLQNRTYLGLVRYKPYQQSTDEASSKTEIEWFKGKHDAVIPQQLFDRCQEVRLQRRRGTEYTPKYRIFLLKDIIYCADCVENKPDDLNSKNYGKMRPQSNTYGKHRYYRCRARDLGYVCPQGSTRADVFEEQVIHCLKTVKLPDEWYQPMVDALAQKLGDKKLEARLAEVKTVIERMDFRWDQGFITDKDIYLEQRAKLQQELDRLAPTVNNERETAADIIGNFSAHWQNTKDNQEAQSNLIHLIVSRVWVRQSAVVGILFFPDFYYDLGWNQKSPL